jgi:hypothetical protein
VAILSWQPGDTIPLDAKRTLQVAFATTTPTKLPSVVEDLA